MNFLLFFLVALVASIVDDVLVIFYLRRVVDDDIVRAVVFSMALGTVQLIGTNFFIESRWYGMAVVLGNGIGTALAMIYERKYPAKKPRDKKTGRFKPPISQASFQLGERM
jgi:hypothetical protein